MSDAIVVLTLAFVIGLPVAWLLRPDLRAWLERPKYRLQDNLRHFDGKEKGV